MPVLERRPWCGHITFCWCLRRTQRPEDSQETRMSHLCSGHYSVCHSLASVSHTHPFHVQNALTGSDTQSPETQLELDASIGKWLKSGLPAAFQAGSSRAKCWGCKCESGSAPPPTTHQATVLRREGKQMRRAFCLQSSGDQACTGHTSRFLISLSYFLQSNDQMRSCTIHFLPAFPPPLESRACRAAASRPAHCCGTRAQTVSGTREAQFIFANNRQHFRLS